ncbi:MAG: hypothetical protein QOE70_6719 [Chthoniobacter sp.]|jgi:hypothetical protein|nr:hypothetical protein [Chthoniobacter sp.]
MQSPTTQLRSRGTTTIVALLTMTALAGLSATLLFSLSTRYNGMANAVAWRQAINAAESAADVAVMNLRWSITAGAPTAFAPESGWSGPDADGTYTLKNLSVQEATAGATRLWANATVEASADLKDAKGIQWYRIRGTGYAALPGLRRASNDLTADAATRGKERLRKLDYLQDHFIAAYGEFGVGPVRQAVSAPQATRRIEVIVQPQGRWTAGVVANESYDFPLIDSFDSTDPAKSNPDGTYNQSKRQEHGDVVVNSTDVPSGKIYGNASINAGGALTGWGSPGAKTSNKITGEVSNNVYSPTPPVLTPNWPSKVNLGSAPASITPSAAVSYYQASSLNGVTITLPPGQTSATVNLLVTGDITGGITVAKGVTAKIYFAGDFSMKSSAIDNLNDRAANLRFYGINPPAGQTQTVNIGSGSPGYVYAAWYAPAADFSTNGNPDFCGSFVGKSFSGNGNCTLHYDESLAGLDVLDFQKVSWIEDPR